MNLGNGDGADSSDRRGEGRQIAIYRVAKLITDRGEQLGRVRNISSGGLMAEVQGSWCVGEPAAVELKAGGDVPGRVVWAEEGRIGIAFDDPIDPGDILAADPEQARRMIRVAVSARISLCLGRGMFRRVSVVDISLGGIRIVLDEPDCVGREAIVTLKGLPSATGIVRWQRDGHAGIAFDKPPSLDTLSFWLIDRG
jgi:hypothetical protein